MVKKINFKKNEDEMFVTFHYVNDIHGNYVPIAIRCKDYENALEVASDINSLLDIQFLYINKSGFLREDSVIGLGENYLNGKCNFQNMYKEYFNKHFRCNTCKYNGK